MSMPRKIKANLNTRTRWVYDRLPDGYKRRRVIVHRWSLPADEAGYNQMVDQAHAAIANDPDYAGIAHHQYLDLVGTVLGSLGITRPTPPP